MGITTFKIEIYCLYIWFQYALICICYENKLKREILKCSYICGMTKSLAISFIMISEGIQKQRNSREDKS